jgi:hypothetical protein
MPLALPRPVHTPRSGRSTRSGPVRQDAVIRMGGCVSRYLEMSVVHFALLFFLPLSDAVETRGTLCQKSRCLPTPCCCLR